MLYLIVGLVLFLGIHLLKPLDLAWRRNMIARMGETSWKLLFTAVALIAFVAIAYGFAQARQHPTLLYVAPAWTRHLNELLTLVAFVLLAASFVPRNHLRAWLGHPMLAGAKVWALGHLLVNGMLHEVLLFGGFLAWAILAFVAARRRDRRKAVSASAGSVGGDALVVVAGLALWALFALLLHQWLFGVAPLA